MKPLMRRQVVEFAIGMLFVIAVMSWLNVYGPLFDPTWVAKEGEPVPRNFSYLFFPRPVASIVDASGKSIGPLRRAVVLTDEQCQKNGPIDVGGAKDPRLVSRADLTPSPPESESD